MGFLFVIIPSVVNSILYGTSENLKFLLLLFSSGLAFLFIWLSVKPDSFPAINKSDIALLLLFVYMLVNTYLINGQSWDLKSITPFFLFGFYILFRATVNRANAATFLYFLIISGFIQALAGNLQIHELIPSQHKLFKITGSFPNPGPYSGYLASIFPIALGFCVYQLKLSGKGSTKTNLYYYVAIATIVLMLMVIPAALSRAAYISITVSSLYILYMRYSDVAKSLYRRYRILVLTVIPLVVGLCIFLYSIKPGSAQGRLLIWQNCISLILEDPVNGKGSGGFDASYMDRQADYFRQNPMSLHAPLADNAQYAFNDFLQFFVEQGSIGLLLLIAVAYFVFGTKNSSPLMVICKAGLASIALFSLFSYPLEVTVIQMNALLYTSIITAFDENTIVRRPNRLFAKKAIRIFFAIAVIGAGTFLVQYSWRAYCALRHWKLASAYYNWGDYEMSLYHFKRAEHYIPLKGDFLAQFGKNLSVINQDTDAIAVLREAERTQNSSVVQSSLGDSYKRLGQNSLAEKSYLNAHYMIPQRLYYMYLLVIFYRDIGDKTKALAFARKILSTNTKVRSDASDEIYEEMAGFISKN